MANEINRLPEGEMGEVIFNDEVFRDVPDLDDFRDPPRMKQAEKSGVVAVHTYVKGAKLV